MTTRRDVLAGLTVAAGGSLWPLPTLAKGGGAAALIRGLASDPSVAHDNKGTNEAQRLDLTLRSARSYRRAFAPRNTASDRRISPLAEQLIIACEVSNPAVYTRRYQMPVWPGGASGPTIGVGYDLRFIRHEWLIADWGAYLDKPTLDALLLGCTLKGADADRFCTRNRALTISWDQARRQFLSVLLPRYVAETLIALPGVADLSDARLGALVSLVYNRGASFWKAGDRYKEMRAIRFALSRGRPEEVPGQILAMKRLWPSVRGLRLRREAEAALFREG